ncbi:MAG: Zn-dependent alcohol dehydrogenase [Dehalococcoidales bacterium]|nr:Zn-dependent alcohol dehydrogenase [Dehalococcoidales bacterium]
MKAAVCYEAGKPLVVEEIKLDQPKQGEVKIKMAATAVCHSDIHFFMGELPGQTPFVGGHESAGYVDEVGPGVTDFKKGDPVLVSLLYSCGKCLYCRTGRSHLCTGVFPLDTETRMHNMKGEPLTQNLKISSFADYTIIDQSQLVKLPADIPMDSACMLACGVITGFGAVVNKAKVGPNDSCAIVGVGGVGINAIQGAAISGAYPVIAVDISDSKLETAKKFGATHTVNSSKVDPVEAVQKITGEGADYVFVTVGNTKAFTQGFNMSSPCGTTVLVGLAKFDAMAEFSPFLITRFERTVTGSFMGTTQLQTEIPKLVKLYQAGILKLDELITHRFPLEKINEAIDEVVQGKALRNIIVFK